MIIPIRFRIRQAFSLIELLVVMAGAVAMVAVAGSTFTNSGTSISLATGGNRVAAMFEQARQNSITKGAMTAVAISTEPASEGHYRALIMLEATAPTDGSELDASDWHPVSKWEILPKGITVDEDCTFTNSSTKLVSSFPPTLPPQGGKAITSFCYVIFLPNGRIQGEATPGIKLVEGWRPTGANAPKYTHLKPDGTPANYYRISVLCATGRLKIDRP